MICISPTYPPTYWCTHESDFYIIFFLLSKSYFPLMDLIDFDCWILKGYGGVKEIPCHTATLHSQNGLSCWPDTASANGEMTIWPNACASSTEAQSTCQMSKQNLVNLTEKETNLQNIHELSLNFQWTFNESNKFIGLGSAQEANHYVGGTSWECWE